MTLSRASCRSTVKELIDAGKAKCFGLSETGPQVILGAQAVRPVSGQDVQEYFPVLGELSVGFVAYSSLGRGFITGTAPPADERDVPDMRHVDPRRQHGTSRRTSWP